MRSGFLLILLILVAGCASTKKAYGPIMSRKDINETFQPILDLMEYKPGMSFADVGAGSGAITVTMSALMDGSVIYIQDIDTATLNDRTVNKIIEEYSSQSHIDLQSKNKFHVTIGSVEQTNLPEATFDLIYTNGTSHNFTAFDAIMTDMRMKLKPGGMLYVRDSFKGDNGEGEKCSDPKCGRPLLSIDHFLDAMNKNGFELVKRNPNMSGYPVFGFKKAAL